jgi:spore germination cell wall hydrolase CwlJ-like protein
MTQLRAPARELVAAGAFVSMVGLAVGCAYLGGSLTRTADVHARAARLADAARAGYADKALVAATGGLDPASLALARRHVGGEPGRAPILFAATATLRDTDSLRAGLRQISEHPGPAAKPFHAVGDSSRDLDCLSEGVYYEARGEGDTGMQAVAQVILNRVRHPAFPKSVCGVVYQGAEQGACQFSFACEPSRAKPTDAVWIRARAIAGRALAGHVMVEVGNATHFHATRVAPDWRASLLKVVQIGSHIFYRFGGAPGQPGAFHGVAQPSKPGDRALQPMVASLVPNFGGPAAPPPADAKPTPLTQFLQKVLPGADKPAAAPAEAKPTLAKPILAKADTTPPTGQVSVQP